MTRNKKRIIKRNLAYIGRFSMLILFFLGFFPGTPEAIAFRAATEDTIFSWWLILGLIYILGMNEIDIYILSWPLKPVDKRIFDFVFPNFSEKISFLFLKIKKIVIKILDFFKICFNYLKNLLEKTLLFLKIKRNKKKRDYKALFISLEYLGIFICAIIPGFGRLGNFIYVISKEKLKYGRYFIYSGSLIRFLIFFGILSLIWSKI